jgi:hypothetical protein
VIVPQLGNPLVLAITRDGERVGAIRVTDSTGLQETLQKQFSKHGLERLDDYKGALVWKNVGVRRGPATYGALREAELVVAPSEAVLHSAIEAAAGTANLAFSRAFTSTLPKRGAATLVSGVGDGQRVLASGDPGQAALARKVPWLRALGTFTLTARVSRRKIGVHFELVTDRVRLSERDLPLRPGAASPRLHDPAAAAAVAVLEPRRLVRVLEQTLHATDASRFDRYQAGIEQLRAIFGVDVRRDLLEKLTSLSIAVSSATAVTFEASLKPGTGPSFLRDLEKARPFVEGVLNDSLPGTSVEAESSGNRGTWVVRNRGVVLGRYGMRNGTLVGSVGLSALPRPVAGKRLQGVNGSLVLRGDIARIGRLVGFLLEVPERTFSVITGLGDLEIGIRTTTHGLSATGRIALDKAR